MINYFAVPGVPKRTEFTDKERQAMRIIHVAAKHFGVKPIEVVSNTRRRPYKTARQIAIYLIRTTITGLSHREVGEMFGGRDHSTVVHTIKLVKSKLSMAEPDEIVEDLKQINGKIIFYDGPIEDIRYKQPLMPVKKNIPKQIIKINPPKQKVFERVKGEYSNMRLYDQLNEGI